jgi:hypothetical protein
VNANHEPEIESEALSDFVKVMQGGTVPVSGPSCGRQVQRGRINVDQEGVKNGLAQLVLTLVKLLHDLLERQAIRRIDAGSLSDDEIERVGVTLMRQVGEIERLRKAFGLEEEDLNMDLGPLGKLL